MRSGISLSLCALLLVLALGQGCSSSPTAGEESSSDMGALESGADEVGSIPEDMLAKEELPMGTDSAELAEIAPESTTENPEAEKDPAAEMTAGATQATDPFGDLADSESKEVEAAEGGHEGSGNVDTYEVKAGDTLMKIAFTIYGDIDRWKELEERNQGKFRNANQLKVGMKLSYETPLNPFQLDQLSHSYTIKHGDTLAGIADEVYGRRTKYRKLQKYNERLIKNPHRIFAGFTIFYDITAKEMAEAEARRQERAAGGGGEMPSAVPSHEEVPSSLTPPTPTGDPNTDPLAVGPPAPASTGQQ